MVIRIDIALTLLICLIQVVTFFRWQLRGRILVPVGTWKNGALLARLRFMGMSVVVLWMEADYLNGRNNLPVQLLIACLLMLGQYLEPWIIKSLKR